MPNYPIINPPFFKPFNKLTRREARFYYDWFIGQIPERLTILKTITADENGNILDLTRGSLDKLEQWLAPNIKIRPKTDAEKLREISQMNTLEQKYRSLFSPSQNVFTDETFSLMIDTGMYLGETFRNTFKDLYWRMVDKRKLRVDYQKPVLARFGLIDCDPVHLVHVASLKEWEKPGSLALRNIFDIWSHIKNANDRVSC